jgi:thiamine kinase-like enzyme
MKESSVLNIQLVKKLIAEGNTAEVYQYENDKIIKLFRVGLNDEIINREYSNSCFVANLLKDFVPKTYGLATVGRRKGIIYQKIVGKDLLKILLSSMWKVNSHAKKFAHYHYNMHITVNNTLFTVKEKLTEDLNRVNELDDTTKDMIKEYLRNLPDEKILCHFDFHPGNIIISNDSPIILDWMTACVGDPCADVARTCIMLKYSEIPRVPWIVNKFAGAFQRYLCKVYIKEYLKISGYRIKDIEKWYIPIAAARLSEWIPNNEKKRLINLVQNNLSSISG